MDDTLKNLTIGLFVFALLHGGLEQRARHNATRQMREAFNNTGTIQASVEPRGLFGLYASDVWAVDIYGQHQRTYRLPFYVYPRPGWKGSIRHLRLHLTDFTLSGLPIARFEADLPFVTFDIGHAIWKDRLRLRSAGTGPVTALVDAEGLRTFISHKYHQTLSDVEIWIQNQKIHLKGRIALFTAPVPFIATGTLAPRAGRYIDFADPVILLNRSFLAPQVAQSLLKGINPVLDVQTDLGLSGFFTLTDIEIGDRFVTIRGRATVPPATGPSPSQEKGSGPHPWPLLQGPNR